MGRRLRGFLVLETGLLVGMGVAAMTTVASAKDADDGFTLHMRGRAGSELQKRTSNGEDQFRIKYGGAEGEVQYSRVFTSEDQAMTAFSTML